MQNNGNNTQGHPTNAYDSLVRPLLDPHGDIPDIEKTGRAVEAICIALNGKEELTAIAQEVMLLWESELAEADKRKQAARLHRKKKVSDQRAKGEKIKPDKSRAEYGAQDFNAGRPPIFDLMHRSYSTREKFTILLAIRDYVYVKLDGKERAAQLGPNHKFYYCLMRDLERINGGHLHVMRVKDWLLELIKYLQNLKRPDEIYSPQSPATPKAMNSAVAKGDKEDNLRSWTQPDLDKAIHKYKAERAASYADLLDALKGKKKGAKMAATKTYGRNAIVRALGVRSPTMVSKSPAWLAIAHELGIKLNRNRLKGTRHTQKAGKIGLDMAIEQVSKHPADGADNTPPETALESVERQETLRQINRMAFAGTTTEEKAKNQIAADELIQKLQREECSDDQARQIVEMILHPRE